MNDLVPGTLCLLIRLLDEHAEHNGRAVEYLGMRLFEGECLCSITAPWIAELYPRCDILVERRNLLPLTPPQPAATVGREVPERSA